MLKAAKQSLFSKRNYLTKFDQKNLLFVGLFNNNKIRYLTMLRVGLSPLNAHKKAYNFHNITEFCSICGCAETTEHFLLSCISFRLSRATMIDAISSIMNKNILTLPKSRVVSTLLYGSVDMTYTQNTLILKEVVKFITQSKRLDT